METSGENPENGDIPASGLLVYLRVLLCFWRIQRIQQQNKHPKIFHSKIFHEASAKFEQTNGMNLAQFACPVDVFQGYI